MNVGKKVFSLMLLYSSVEISIEEIMCSDGV